MDINCFSRGIGKSHFKEEIRLAAEGLAVEEVAPSSDDLTDKKAENDKVYIGKKRDLFMFAYQNNGDEAQNYAAEQCHSAFPHGDYFRGVGPVIIPFESDMISACADDADGDKEQDEVIEVILGNSELFASFGAEQNAEHEAERDKNAVDIYLPTEHGE